MNREGQLGVHPPGALGVAFFVHARAECFIGRGGDGITDPLKKVGDLKLDDHGALRLVPLRGRIFSNLLEAGAQERMPELLLICCDPNQLAAFTRDVVRYLENLAERGRLRDVKDVCSGLPILLLMPNGILAEQTISTFEEQVRESRVMGRLPGLTDEMADALLQRVVRGVSLQAGGRRGSGAEAVYILERKGTLVFAGGGEPERERIEKILTAHDYAFKHARGVPGTRIEFDKAMISIVLNVGGLIYTVKPDGTLIDLRMGDLCQDDSKAEFVDRIARAVFVVGKAAGAYPPDADFDAIWSGHRAVIMAHADHVTSSLKTFRDALDRGLSGVQLFSNEEWILTPLARYAAKAGLVAEETLFKQLKQQVQESMARAIRRKQDESSGKHGRNGKMKLAAQRDFSVELYEAGADDMLLIGTMLDSEHLIKLELNVFLPDEQITRARLDVIRAPFPVCTAIEGSAERLVGLRIERGVLGEIVRRIGGKAGCSHVKELATNIVYFAASHLVRRRSGVDPWSASYGNRPPEERFALTKGLLRDSCLAYCQTTPQGLDESVGIRRVGEQHTCPIPIGEYEKSLGVVLRDRAKRFSGRNYIRYRRDGGVVAVSWDEFAAQVRQIARHLIAMGIRRGDALAMLSENRLEMYLFEMAAVSIGAVTVPIFAGYPAALVAYVLDHARPRVVVASGRHQLEKIELHRHTSVERYYCMDCDADSKRRGALDFAELLREGGSGPEELDQRIDAVQPDDVCIVMYTSGTTGPPKGVQICHRNQVAQQKAVSLIWNVSEKDAFLSYLPWHHSFGGLFERFMTLYQGAELCLDDSRGRDIDRLLENWSLYNPTIFCSVPRVHDLLMTRCRENAAADKIVFNGRLRFVFTAGAPLPAAVEAAYQKRNIPVLEGWGLTETSPCCALRTLDAPWRSGYVGAPIPGVTIRIDDDQEILVRGPNVMLGYLNDEDANARVLTDDGWFRTGDLGEYTRDGMRIFGRKDGAFKLTTGEKVHPQRVETVLVNESPFLSEVVVVGSGRNYVAALLFPDFARLREWAKLNGVPEDNLTMQPAVKALYVAELRRINPLIEVKYQRVRRAVIAESEPSATRGEVTPSGKLVRRMVCDTYKRRLDSLFMPQPDGDVIEAGDAPVQQATVGDYANAI
ncbi:MAG: AMP-binding protein [Planctomycetes bacterium]|nr:AMP-binding protein [Planctomycetota bacterium]